MEKMLDKKSRDFAKNMQNTMIYDDNSNEVQVGTNLFVDGKIKAQSVLQFPAFQTMPKTINTDTLPIVNDERQLDARELQEAIFINFTDTSRNTTIFTGNGLIIVDKNIDIVNTLFSMSSVVDSTINFITFDKTNYNSNVKLAIIPLYGAIYVTLSYEY